MAIPPLTRLGAQKITGYIEQVREENYSCPDEETLRAMSGLINRATEKSFLTTAQFLQEQREIQKGVKELREAPLLRGPAKTAKVSLKGFTPYEQMGILSEFIDTTNLSDKRRTLAFSHEDGPIPIAIKPPTQGKLDLYPVFIGNSRGDLKGPSYTDWQAEDPRDTPQQRYIKSLDALEMHRTKKGDGALLLKKGAYESDKIGHDWRYKVYEKRIVRQPVPKEVEVPSPLASVELPGQKQMTAIRARGVAPGYNLAGMIASPSLRDKSIVPERLYEEYQDDGYDDEAILAITPMQLLESLSPQQDTTELDRLVDGLSATHLGRSNIPAVRAFTAKRLGF